MTNKADAKLLDRIFRLEQENAKVIDDTMCIYSLVVVMIQSLRLTQKDNYKEDVQEVIDDAVNYITMIEDVLFGGTPENGYETGVCEINSLDEYRKQKEMK